MALQEGSGKRLCFTPTVSCWAWEAGVAPTRAEHHHFCDLLSTSTRKPKTGSRGRWTKTWFFLPCCKTGQRHKEPGNIPSHIAVSKQQTASVVRFSQRMAESRPGVPSVQQSHARLLAALSEHELAPVDLICRSRPQRRTAANPKGPAKGGARETSLLQTVCLGWCCSHSRIKKGTKKLPNYGGGKNSLKTKKIVFYKKLKNLLEGICLVYSEEMKS